ncbi:MAG: glycine--tRNA ligase subunit beta [Campylobacterales bacterium]|nr:glycine--tRNA ligase subunit beta [Campylobacterales bacterium]
MTKPLLIEIGAEELPAIPFLKELPNIEKKWSDILDEFNLFSDFEFYYTPRRLVFFHKNFIVNQPNKIEEIFGPPVDVAFKNGEKTKAYESFLTKIDNDEQNIFHVEKNGKAVLAYKKEIKGVDSKSLIPQMIAKLITSLNFGKSMRWGSLSETFIRPIRWLGVSFDSEIIDMELFGVKSSNFTYTHRQHSFEKVCYSSIKEYFETLKNGGVILFQEDRKNLILEKIAKIEHELNCHVELDLDLLHEIVAITEYPTPILGSFDEMFLTLPKEVIITSMKEHQRYFAVTKNDSLSNKFIVVSNAFTNNFELIQKGNEKVLRARLSDALFFYNNDLKHGFNVEGLKNVSYIENLGTIFDKTNRETTISLSIAEMFKDRLLVETNKELFETLELIKRASYLSKADLLTEVVYEFTELQGIMGYYYATSFKENPFVANALKEQYLPIREDSELPSTIFSSILALATRCDTLFALFSEGKIPSGNKDPFALRRAAIGIIKIILEKELNFRLDIVYDFVSHEYKKFDFSLLEQFIFDRFYSMFADVNPSIIKAVLSSGEKDILKIAKKIEAMSNIVSKEEFKEQFSTFKRVANITKDVDISIDLTVDVNLFENEYETTLHEEFMKVSNAKYEDYEDKLDKLFGLKKLLDNFFDNVLVNVENESVKNNRKNLIASIYKSFKEIADIKEIAI